jgi:hypothetical protein
MIALAYYISRGGKIGEHAKCWTAAGNSFQWRFGIENLKETLTPMSHYGRNNIWVDRHYSLNLKPWSAGTLYVYAQIQHKNTLLVCRRCLSPGCAPRKKIIFSCPVHKHAYYMTCILHDMLITWLAYYMTCILHDLHITWHAYYMTCILHDLHITWLAYYMTWILHDMHITWLAYYMTLHITWLAYYMTCILHDIHITWHAYYMTCILHDMHITWHAYYMTCILHDLHITCTSATNALHFLYYKCFWIVYQLVWQYGLF